MLEITPNIEVNVTKFQLQTPSTTAFTNCIHPNNRLQEGLFKR